MSQETLYCDDKRSLICFIFAHNSSELSGYIGWVGVGGGGKGGSHLHVICLIPHSTSQAAFAVGQPVKGHPASKTDRCPLPRCVCGCLSTLSVNILCTQLSTHHTQAAKMNLPFPDAIFECSTPLNYVIYLAEWQVYTHIYILLSYHCTV